MKKLKNSLYLLLLASAMLVSCKKDQPSNQAPPVAEFTDLKVPDNFKFETQRNISLNVDLDDQGVGYKYGIRVYDAMPSSDNSSLLYSGYSSTGSITTELTVPQTLRRLYLVRMAPDGSSSLSVVEATGSSITHDFKGKNAGKRKTVVVSPDCNSGCNQTVSSGWLNTSGSTVYCITGNINGINDNSGNATLRICGNITISNNISISGNTKLEITDGSSLTVPGINMNNNNGNQGQIIVYTTGTLTITNNFSAYGTITNHGTFNINSESYLYGVFTNNGTFHTKGVNSSTHNNNGPITNNGTMIYDGNLTENNNTTFNNNCYLWVKKKYEINSLVNNYSYIQVDGNFRSNGNSTLNFYNGAMMFVKGNAAGPLNGDMVGNGTTSVVKITGGISSNSGADFTGNLEVCASSYGTNGSNNITQNGALKNGAVAVCDQAYIPTGACNPEGNGTPTVTDTDGDGVADDNDLFPNDPLRAGESFYPGSNQMGTLAYEDLWPAKGDYDFNDIVLDYRYRLITDADNNVKDIEVTYALRAIGGTFRNGFGLQLGVAPSAVASVSRNVNFAPNSSSGTGVESGQAKAVIIFFENAFDVLANNGTQTVNTNPAETSSPVDTNSLTITFTNAVSAASLGTFPYNPFIYTNRTRGQEVHLSGKEPTDLANLGLFGQVDDDTEPGQGRYYVTENNLPWAINITQQFDYPQEKKDIVQAYLNFASWAQSGGASSTDWYLDNPGNRTNSLIY